MDQTSHAVIQKLRNNLDKVLIIASGITILIGGYFTLDYRSYTNCQAQLLEASQASDTRLNESLQVLLTQPPRSVDERRRALEQLQVALDRQLQIERELGSCR